MATGNDPIQIDPGEEGRLIVRFAYTPERVAQIKTVPGRRWHPEKKFWTVSNVPEMPARLRKLFAGEPVEQGAPLGFPGPTEYPILDKVRQAIRAHHYRTIFSHDGSRFALLTSGRPHSNDGSGKFLIIQSVADNKISKTALPSKSQGGTLLFTPSGETIVGVLHGGPGVQKLNIWNSADGALLVSRDLPFCVGSGGWPPILAPDGTSILIFENIGGGRFKQHSVPIAGSTKVH